MPSRLNPYLGFKGNAREAMEFYKSVFGGKLDLQTFGENHAASDPSENDLIMHSQLEAGELLTLMGSDTPKHIEFKKGSQVSLSLSGDDDAELSGYFNKLAAGGNITQPLVEAPWGDKFGMVVDKFGMTWLVNIAKPKA